MLTVVVLNIKGGVGKTSTTHHLAGTLASEGRKVLLVDLDPQASLTQGLLGSVATVGLAPEETVATLFRGETPFPEQLIRETSIAGVHLVPGSGAATRFNVPEPELAPEEQQTCIREFLAEVDGYDIALLDGPPNLHLCSWSALVAADYLLVPTQPEDYGAQGLRDVRRSMKLVQAGPNPGLKLLGYLLTMVVERRTVHQVYESNLRATYGDAVLVARVPEAADYVEAIMVRKPIAQFKPRSKAARAIKDLAAEVMDRAGVGAVQGAVREAS